MCPPRQPVLCFSTATRYGRYCVACPVVTAPLRLPDRLATAIHVGTTRPHAVLDATRVNSIGVTLHAVSLLRGVRSAVRPSVHTSIELLSARASVTSPLHLSRSSSAAVLTARHCIRPSVLHSDYLGLLSIVAGVAASQCRRVGVTGSGGCAVGALLHLAPFYYCRH